MEENGIGKFFKKIVWLFALAGVLLFVFFIASFLQKAYNAFGGGSSSQSHSTASDDSSANGFGDIIGGIIDQITGGGQSSKVNPSGEWQSGELKIHFLDVGQGDCTLIELPDGKKMMIDGGNGERENNQKILNYLDVLNVDKLDFLLVTHADIDHYGGIESVLNEIEVSKIYLPYEATLNSQTQYLTLYQTALKKVPSVNYSKRYTHIQGENYFLMFLSPTSLALENEFDDNEHSAVVWLDYMGTSALFTGDMTSDTEKALYNEYTLLGGDIFDLKDMHVALDSTEILKVAHHGSAYSSSLQWLQLLNLQTSVVSCGRDNFYNHPSDTALENLRSANPEGEIYRTDECGNIVVTSTGGGTYSTVYQSGYTN